MTIDKKTSQTEQPRRRGRPPKKKVSLEEEAREFFNKRVQEDLSSEPSGVPSLRNFYAGSALSGLLASGKYHRADELVEEAFRYADLMIRKK